MKNILFSGIFVSLIVTFGVGSLHERKIRSTGNSKSSSNFEFVNCLMFNHLFLVEMTYMTLFVRCCENFRPFLSGILIGYRSLVREVIIDKYLTLKYLTKCVEKILF